MSEFKKINVALYGGKGIFGGRETPLEADIIYCDKCDVCSFYKQQKCLNLRSPFSPYCKFGKRQTVRGYTSRSQKYYSFRENYTKDESYSKLSYPQDWTIASIGDYILLNLIWLTVEKRCYYNWSREWKDTEDYHVNDCGFSTGKISYIPKQDFTLELMEKVINSKATAIMGGEIPDYKNKTLPNLIQELKKEMPSLYEKLIKKYPEHNKEPNYIGRYAYMNTLKDGCRVMDCHGNEFLFKDKRFYCENMTRGFVPFDGVAKVEVKVDDKKVIKITNNSQWDENTKFR